MLLRLFFSACCCLGGVSCRFICIFCFLQCDPALGVPPFPHHRGAGGSYGAGAKVPFSPRRALFLFTGAAPSSIWKCRFFSASFNRERLSSARPAPRTLYRIGVFFLACPANTQPLYSRHGDGPGVPFFPRDLKDRFLFFPAILDPQSPVAGFFPSVPLMCNTGGFQGQPPATGLSGRVSAFLSEVTGPFYGPLIPRVSNNFLSVLFGLGFSCLRGTGWTSTRLIWAGRLPFPPWNLWAFFPNGEFFDGRLTPPASDRPQMGTPGARVLGKIGFLTMSGRGPVFCFFPTGAQVGRVRIPLSLGPAGFALQRRFFFLGFGATHIPLAI